MALKFGNKISDKLYSFAYKNESLPLINIIINGNYIKR